MSGILAALLLASQFERGQRGERINRHGLIRLAEFKNPQLASSNATPVWRPARLPRLPGSTTVYWLRYSVGLKELIVRGDFKPSWGLTSNRFL